MSLWIWRIFGFVLGKSLRNTQNERGTSLDRSGSRRSKFPYASEGGLRLSGSRGGTWKRLIDQRVSAALQSRRPEKVTTKRDKSVRCCGHEPILQYMLESDFFGNISFVSVAVCEFVNVNVRVESADMNSWIPNIFKESLCINGCEAVSVSVSRQ